MLKNYFKIAWRNLWKHRLFSLINIIGLGLAMSFCLLVLIQVQASFERDMFHPYPDRTYRIITDVTNQNGDVFSLASTPFPLGDKLQKEQSSIEKSARVIRGFDATLSNRVKSLRVSGLFADPAYFELFGFKLAKGMPAIEPRTVVLTRETAERFFGTADPVGKTLEQEGLGVFTVTGVFASFKGKTHLESDLVVSMATYPLLHPEARRDNWTDYNTYTYVLMREGSGAAKREQALQAVVNDNQKNGDLEGIKGHVFRSQLVTRINPDTQGLLNNPYVEPLFKVLVNIIMALLIVSLAGFNYVNLTLTRSLSRAREVGIRKVAGAARRQLIIQFLTESVLVAFLALCIGYLGLLFMRSFIHAGWLTWEVNDTRQLWLTFAGFALLTGCVAGFLPARILSAYHPVQILRGTAGPAQVGRTGIRKALIAVQFIVSLVFMIFTATMYSQFRYMATDNENFNRRNIVNIPLTAGQDYRLLANELSQEAGIESIGAASASFNEDAGRAKIQRLDTDDPAPDAKETYFYAVDPGFIKNMQLTFLAGHNLPAAARDTISRFVLLNEKAVEVLNLGSPQEAVGSVFLLDSAEVSVSGVVKNFRFMRYELPVSPLVLKYDPAAFHLLSVRVSEDAAQEKITGALGQVWKRLYPQEAFVHSWYEQQLYEQYLENEDLKLFGVIVIIVFVIAALGLLGMVTYNTERRTKEVGIRKVMGAGVLQVIRLLSWGFLKIILVSAAIAIPLGYFLGSLFLNIFTYHTRPGIGVFLMCLVNLLIVGFLTIGVQTYRTALTNPARTLRAE